MRQEPVQDERVIKALVAYYEVALHCGGCGTLLGTGPAYVHRRNYYHTHCFNPETKMPRITERRDG